MPKVFIDESGNNPQDVVFLMAGWVADVETWESFSDDWDSVLRRPPAISYFKHHEAKAQSEQFEGFTPKQADRKILELALVIDRHIDTRKKHVGLITGMKHEVLKRIMSRSVASKKQTRSVFHEASLMTIAFNRR